MEIVEQVFEKTLREVVNVDDMQCVFKQFKGVIDMLIMVRMLWGKI